MTVKWIDNKYGSGCRATVGTGLVLSIEGDIGTRNGPPPLFKVTIFEASLRKKFAEREDAKRVAEQQAKLWLTNALKTFDTEAL